MRLPKRYYKLRKKGYIPEKVTTRHYVVRAGVPRMGVPHIFHYYSELTMRNGYKRDTVDFDSDYTEELRKEIQEGTLDD